MQGVYKQDKVGLAPFATWVINSRYINMAQPYLL